METLRKWVTTRDIAVDRTFSSGHRCGGRDMYRRTVSVLTGISIRAAATATRCLWEELGLESKNAWGQLADLLKRRENGLYLRVRALQIDELLCKFS